MTEAIFDGTCQIYPDEKTELDIPIKEHLMLLTPKENHSKNRIEEI